MKLVAEIEGKLMSDVIDDLIKMVPVLENKLEPGRDKDRVRDVGQKVTR